MGQLSAPKVFKNLTSTQINYFLSQDHERNWMWIAKLPLQPHPHQKSQQVIQIVILEMYNTYKEAFLNKPCPS
jgi:hypothetical protein